MRSPLSVCVLYSSDFSDALAQSLSQYLEGEVSADETPIKTTAFYGLTQFSAEAEFFNFIKPENHHVDCLILQESFRLQALLDQLQQRSVFFPAVILQSTPSDRASSVVEAIQPTSRFIYHAAVLELSTERLNQIGEAIDQAISKFIQLSHPNETQDSQAINVAEPPIAPRALMVQQVRLAEKLKERLGYLGVYYKRNPQNFLRHMTQPQRKKLLRQLITEYREIILTYFSDETNLNQQLDSFVNTAFFADVPVSQIVEIHMELMDEFSKQLKLEGRSDEILQDYRLTLIDTLAHLCEMYRRSIPRKS